MGGRIESSESVDAVDCELTIGINCWYRSWLRKLGPMCPDVVKMSKLDVPGCTLITMLLLGGCHPGSAQRVDHDVYRLIAERQRTALGTVLSVQIERESDANGEDGMYSFSPRPVDPGLPEAFHLVEQAPEAGDPSASEDQVDEGGDEDVDQLAIPGDTEMSPDIFSPEDRERARVMGLRDVLAYAMRHARELQDAKEDLYLAALDLSLERHLWTPQFVAEAESMYQDFAAADDDGAVTVPASDAGGGGAPGVSGARSELSSGGGFGEPDRALNTVSEVSVSQRLPFGGEVSARVIHSLMRDVGERVSKGESGQVILAANIPLLRGAGHTAYESRYVAERELVYAVRIYERFRRTFLVDVAADYFNLQQSKAAIANTFTSYLSLKQASQKADFENRLGRKDIFEASRAKSTLRSAEAALVSAKERYESSLDRFKIRVAMPVGELLDVVSQDEDEDSKAVDALLPDIDQAEAIRVALIYRLDLLNVADQVDDTRRGVQVARNRILPDLDLTAGATFDSDPDHRRATTLRHERATWSGGISLRLDDRRTELNAHRAARVSLRRAQRSHEEFVDIVRADVRRALRRVAQQESLRRIQELNVPENEMRLDAARAKADLGLTTNQDAVDAENDLLDARNNLARAVAEYRVAILEFRRDTGTLRVTDDGRWDTAPGNTVP